MAVRVDSDRHYPNSYVGREDLVRPPENFKKQIRAASTQLLTLLEKEQRKAGHQSSDYSIYTGSTGIALMYWHLARLMNKSEYRQKALEILEGALSSLNRKKVSFLGGDAGPLALAAVIYNETGNYSLRNRIIQKLTDLSTIVCDTSDPSASNELLFGRAGYLYALLFVNKFTGGELVTADLIKQVVRVIIQEGQRSGKQYLYYEWHDKCYIGAGHGIIGVIHILLSTPESLSQDDFIWIRRTLDWLLSLRFPSGNIPSSLESRSNDRLIHWCHGASGAIWTWFLAYQIFKDERYLTAGVECANVVWNRGLLRKGYSLCHGVTSNAYGLIAAYMYTKDVKYLEQAFLFAHWCFSYGSKCNYPPDRPLSLFEGLAGVVYMLADFGWNEAPTFPAYCI